MNYYPHHVGDFNSATRHLTRIERSIYRDLMDLYYDAEMPLTLDFAVLCRRIIARDEDEREAVKQVLSEFFVQTDKGWTHKRCDEEIRKYHEGLEKSAAGGKAKASKVAASKVQAESEEDSHQRALSVGADAAAFAQAASNVREGCAQDASTLREGANQNQNQNQNQNHIKTLDKSLVNSTSGSDAHSEVERSQPGRNVEISILLRAGGVKPMTAMHPSAVEWADKGVTDAVLRAGIDTARQYKPEGDISPNYLKPIIEQLLAGPTKSTQNRGIHAERAAVLDELTGRTSAADDIRTIDGEARVVG